MRSSVCGSGSSGLTSSQEGSSSGSSSDEPWGSGSASEADEDAPAFCEVRVRRDLRGVDRFVTAHRCGGGGRA